VVGGRGEVGERDAVPGFQTDLFGRTSDGEIESGDEGDGGVAEFADVEVVEVGIVLGTTADAGAPEGGDFSKGVGALVDGVDLAALDVHAAGEDGVGPAIVGVGGGANVF